MLIKEHSFSLEDWQQFELSALESYESPATILFAFGLVVVIFAASSIAIMVSIPLAIGIAVIGIGTLLVTCRKLETPESKTAREAANRKREEVWNALKPQLYKRHAQLQEGVPITWYAIKGDLFYEWFDFEFDPFPDLSPERIRLDKNDLRYTTNSLLNGPHLSFLTVEILNYSSSTYRIVANDPVLINPQDIRQIK